MSRLGVLEEAAAALAGSVRGACGADAGPGAGVVGVVEANRMAERESAAPGVRAIHGEERIELLREGIEARGRVREES